MLCLLWNYIYEKKQWLKITFKTHLDDRCFGSQINPKPKIILVANGKLDLQVTEALERGLQVFEKKKQNTKTKTNQNIPEVICPNFIGVGLQNKEQGNVQ